MIVAAEPAPARAEVVALYDAVEWTAYTKHPDALLHALAHSHTVLTARDDDGRLVGLARTVSDDVSICYLQDLLVHPDHQRAGVGRALLQDLQRRYAHCRAFVLMTDLHTPDPRDPGPHAFYRELGMVPFGEQGLIGFLRA